MSECVCETGYCVWEWGLVCTSRAGNTIQGQFWHEKVCPLHDQVEGHDAHWRMRPWLTENYIVKFLALHIDGGHLRKSHTLASIWPDPAGLGSLGRIREGE